MKKINIQNEANINAQGKLSSRNCKAVVCLETGDVYSSATDAAENAGVSLCAMSAHLTGKSRSVKGKHYCYLSRVNESLNAIVTRLRETSALEEDAKKWQAYEAEQNAARKAEEARIAAERKAKEKHEADIAKATAKVERLTNKCAEYEAKWRESVEALNAAEMELEALRDAEAA